jgi:hypothetical protein
MNVLEVFNAMQSGSSVKIIDKLYLQDNGIVNNIFTVMCIYCDNVISLIDDKGSCYSDLYCNDIILFF